MDPVSAALPPNLQRNFVATLMRKPEERIYEHTLDVMGVPAEEAVFLDDIAG